MVRGLFSAILSSALVLGGATLTAEAGGKGKGNTPNSVKAGDKGGAKAGKGKKGKKGKGKGKKKGGKKGGKKGAKGKKAARAVS